MDFPGEKLVIRMWETLVEKGIGSLLKPYQEKRERRTLLEMRQEEILGIAQAEKYADDIRAGRIYLRYDVKHRPMVVYNDRYHVPDVAEQFESLERKMPLFSTLQANLLVEHLRKEVNTAKAIIVAEAELAGETEEPTSTTINDDWLYRWRNYASQVSAGELQSLWGRILAGEIKSPGNFSLRTLEFLHNLSVEEAVEIAKLSRLVIDDFICTYASAIFEEEGLSLTYFFEMEHLGIISGVAPIGLQVKLNSEDKVKFLRPLCSNGRVLLVQGPDANKELDIPIYSITKLGKEVLGLGRFEAHEKYLREVGSKVKSKGFEVAIADYVKLPPNRIRTSNVESL